MNSAVRHKNRSAQSVLGTRGFTLIELLVGMTIFIVIMASVTLMFNAVVRTTKIGYQNQTAYQVVRGVFDTMEHDVTRAFTSRETGLKETFYGSPYGFSFIGLVDTDGSGEYNSARITYVIYTQMRGGETDDALRVVYNSVDSELAASGQRVTYSLLRYIEPGVDNLDSYPISWDAIIQDDVGNPTTLQACVNVLATTALNFDICEGNPDCYPTNFNDPDGALQRSIKRELWIRMLAGDNSVFAQIGGENVRVPSFWDNASAVRVDAIAGTDLNPADYILAENILHVDRLTDATIATRTGNGDYAERGSAPTTYDPNDTDTYDKLNSTEYPLIDFNGEVDMALIDLTEALLDPVGDPTDLDHFLNYRANFLPNPIPVNMVRDYFFSYRDGVENIQNTTKLDTTGTNTLINDTILTSRDFAYWNDWRNLEFGVGVSREAGAFYATPALTEDVISTVPDIMDSDFPESIQFQFTLFYPTPYAGAPDFEKTFTHIIDLPTGLRREQESLRTKLQRDID